MTKIDDLKAKLLEIYKEFEKNEEFGKIEKNGFSTRIKLNYLFISNLVDSMSGRECVEYKDALDLGGSESRIGTSNSGHKIMVTGKQVGDGQNMGTVVLFNDKYDVGTIKDLSSKTFDTLSTVDNDNEETSRKFARSKAIYSILQKKRTSKLIESELLESQAGISIQYSHVRLEGIKRYLEEIGFAHINISPELINAADLSPLFTHNINNETQLPPKLVQLISHMTKFNYHRKRGIEEPSVFVNYTVMLAKTVSSLYYHFRVKNEKENIQIARWIILGLAKRMLFVCISVTGLVPMDIV
jgi:arginyl-tRNA synthetase